MSKKEPERKLRRVVRRKKHIPKLEDLYREAYDRGMTVGEYVNYLNAMNMDRSKRRNNSSTYNTYKEPQ